jgi:A/G-specific adenine glycosylase
MMKTRRINVNSDFLDPEELKVLPANRKPGPDIFVRFKKAILCYYEREGRDLAWRHTTDPYHILVSEIMLQQTQVGRVTVKYPEFIEAFPSFARRGAIPRCSGEVAGHGLQPARVSHSSMCQRGDDCI